MLAHTQAQSKKGANPFNVRTATGVQVLTSWHKLKRCCGLFNGQPTCVEVARRVWKKQNIYKYHRLCRDVH